MLLYSKGFGVGVEAAAKATLKTRMENKAKNTRLCILSLPERKRITKKSFRDIKSIPFGKSWRTTIQKRISKEEKRSFAGVFSTVFFSTWMPAKPSLLSSSFLKKSFKTPSSHSHNISTRPSRKLRTKPFIPDSLAECWTKAR